MITLIGAGFLGSIYAEEVAKRLWAHDMTAIGMRIIDFDIVEARNIANQNFDMADVGRDKANCVAGRVERYNVPTDPRNHKATDDNKDDLLRGTSLLVSATDNMEARNLAWYHATANKIPLLHLGISQGGVGAVEWTVWDEYESWSLSPMALRGKQAPPDPEVRFRPCELVGFRGLGLNCAVAGAKATAIFLGRDSEKSLAELVTQEQPRSIFTTWSINNLGHSLQDTFILREVP